MDLNDLQTKISYFCREQFYNLMLQACRETLSKIKDNPTIHLYHALALALCNRLQDAVDQLETFKLEEDIKLAAVIALMYTHKLKHTTDKEVFFKLDAQMREFRKSANALQLYNVAIVLVAYKKYNKALDYIEKSLSFEPKQPESLLLRGWILIELARKGERNVGNISQIFENLNDEEVYYLDISLGLSECYANESKYTEALNVINKAIIRFNGTNLPLVQKMKLQFAMQDWEQAIETMNRVQSTDAKNLEAMQVNILILLCRDAKYEDAAYCIRKFVSELEKIEPRNSILLLETAQLFSRICGRHLDVLTETYRMAEKAQQISANNADLINELGYQCLLQGKVKEALKFYKSATKINDSSIDALMGLTLCELSQNGVSEQIRNQIEFLLELDESVSPKLLFMQSKLCDGPQEARKLLTEAIDKHLSPLRNCPYNATYLRRLDSDFLLEIIKDYLNSIPCAASYISEPKYLDEKTSSNLVVALNTLKIITKACPGLEDALFLLAKVQNLSGERQEATANLEHLLKDLEGVVISGDASLLLAQIQVHDGGYEKAAQTLELGLSRDFNIREDPLYHYIMGLIEKQRGNRIEAINSLKTALKTLDSVSAPSSDGAAIYLELIHTYLLANKTADASELLQEAMERYQGTAEDAKFAMLNAELCLKRNDLIGAVDVLSGIKPTDCCYLESKKMLSRIFLNEKVDKKAYVKCYEEMVSENPTSESYLLLGDAYMEILEPDKALENYKQALELNPRDKKLMSKMGQALIKTHNYLDAIDYYKDAIRTVDYPELKLELSDLYVLLDEHDKAEMLLMSEVESDEVKNASDVPSLQYKTKLLTMLSLTQGKLGNLGLALSTLKEARDSQARVRKRLAVENSVVPQEEIKCAIEISKTLAELAVSLRDNEQAINHFKDGLSLCPDNVKLMVDLAKLYMQMSYLELCQQMCTNILNLDESNETAAVLMADIAFRKVDFDMAIFHFTQLMNRHPTNWETFARFIEIMRRTGTLSDVQQYLQTAEKLSDPKEPGFCYCKALFEWYSGNFNGALMNFNSARQDHEWGERAIYNMIEICFNPNDEMLGEQLMENYDTEYKDSRSMALRMAERLLKELRQFDADVHKEFKYKLVSNFILLATKDKGNVEAALEEFILLANRDEYKDHIGPILGVATAYTLLKQSQRAKNQLKRVMKNLWTFEDAEYLERCWLLLADYYIQSNKADMASDLLRRVIQYNKSCTKAYEMSGCIAEKEQRYKEAANFFESSWKYGGRANPAVGYKVAYNFMKSKKYADAIDVCQQVLSISPDYPRIKKDIMDKSINNLRT